MRKPFILFLPLLVLAFVACSDDDTTYNADTAVTPYQPSEGAKVGSIKMRMNDGARDHSWDYKFHYDAKNRIKQIETKLATHAKNSNGRWYKVNVTNTANYIFTANDGLMVVYTREDEFPQYPAWNAVTGGRYSGSFDSNGRLTRFGPFDCEYNMGILSKTHLDNGRIYTIYRDTYGNITGYDCDSVGKQISHRDVYAYSRERNMTNFDFSAFVGNLVIEREIAENYNWYFAPFHLGAFEMFGVGAWHLPDGEWTMNGDLPVKYVHPKGYEMEIEYIE